MTATPILLGTPHDIEPGDLWRPAGRVAWWEYHYAATDAWRTYWDEYRDGAGGSAGFRNPHLVEIVRGAAAAYPGRPAP